MSDLAAEVFMILDMDSGNAVAFYDSEPEAMRALQSAVDTRPQEAAELMLIAYDKQGQALRRVTGFSLLAAE
jgi:hypothetical protein